MLPMQVEKDDILRVIDTIKKSSTYDFSDYSEKSFGRRIEKILIDTKLDIDGLNRQLKASKEFLEHIVKEITVNTTELFRDPKMWHTIKYRILPRFQEQDTINIWHAGCSTGQEVYSMSILLNELGMLDKCNIFASDLNTDALEAAKRGEYKYRFNVEYIDNFNKVIRQNPYNFEEVIDIPFTKYFDIDLTKDLLRVKPFLKQKPIFRKQDLVKDENVFYTKFDIILCRNVLIYFNYDLQNKIFENFHKNLFNKGVLILGIHESMLGPVSSKYIKKGMYYLKK